MILFAFKQEEREKKNRRSKHFSFEWQNSLEGHQRTRVMHTGA